MSTTQAKPKGPFGAFSLQKVDPPLLGNVYQSPRLWFDVYFARNQRLRRFKDYLTRAQELRI
jgi:hypothetical protein